MTQSQQPQQAGHRPTVVRTAGRELIVTRTFERPARAVFDAWTRPELFSLWWAPGSMGAVLSACQIDARTGGGYQITFSAGGGEGDDDGGTDSATFFGRYLEVAPPSRLVWTNEESPDAPVTTVTFEDQGAQTLLVLSELYPAAPPADAVAGMQAMASEQFAQLDDLLASLR
jgi:uncharacterized protein YndB with AHSA1/START domain